MTQFAFLQAEFSEIFEHAARAESLAVSDPRGACFYARFALETAVKWMYSSDRALKKPYDTALAALIHEPTFRQTVGNGLVTKARIVKDFGNKAVHDKSRVNPKDAVVSVRELFHFCFWLARTYGRGTKPDQGLRFSAETLPRTTEVPAETLARLQEVARRFADKAKAQQEAEQARLQTEEQRAELEAEIKRLQDEVAAVKKANQAIPDEHDYNEAATRETYIDLLLHKAGWPLDQTRDREFEVTGMPNKAGNGFVDYVLWGDDGKPLALIEAKRTRRDPRVGKQQAKLYADCLESQFGQRPIIFYTNGYEHWIWDDRDAPPRETHGFYKKDELMLAHQRRTSKKPLASVAIDQDIVNRPYQIRAIRRVGEAFEADNLRKCLLVMATGSGKTRMTIALVDQLMRANRVKRVLFLADRVALVNQAVRAFKSHMPHAAPVNLVTDKQAEGRVFVSTYPTMMGLIDEEQNGVWRFGPGHFDLIVIDEAHRSVYRKYRAIFDYFDSYLVGLTATPKDEIDRDTYSLFDLERGVPTDSYDLKDAVADGYLVPLKAVSVPLKFQRQGIKYDDLSEEEKEDWDALEWSEDGVVPEQVDPGAINQWLFNEDTVDKVLEHVMTHGQKVEDGDRLGKTIIFAKNQRHAEFIAERFDANYPHLKGHFARTITFKIEYAQSLIDSFSDASKDPHIAISVDMLDTGIDVPEVVNLVFFKIVRSRTKFWQMIGRGTRLCPDLFGPGRHKDHFLVFDFCQNFEFFNENPEASEGALGKALGERLFAARVELIGALDHLPDGHDVLPLFELRESLAERLRAEVDGMTTDNFIVRPKRFYVEKYQEKSAWDRLDLDARAELTEHVAGLPTAFRDDDIAARQFDYLLLSMQLSCLQSDPSFEERRERVMKIAQGLSELGNIPMVAKEMPLILDLLSDEYWRDITLPMLETLRRRLRLLVKLIEPKARTIVYTDFEDEIGAGADVGFSDIGSGTDEARFKRKVRHFLQEHSDHITIRKLHRNEQLTPQDLAELERIFRAESYDSDEDLDAIRETGGLGLFIRMLAGLDREAAKAAFADFLDGKTLSANQIEFVDLIIETLTEQGVMDPGMLYESPFTDFDELGVSGLFPDADVKVLVSVLKDIRGRTAA